ncbi:ACP7 [Bugula neritina]|uniref:ACP7 n=1 Tax=Bugula neritina TaxID=10212 RepID=A0A7J7JXM2_BUGNE|nr:ACP7 [Bugula neritina]
MVATWTTFQNTKGVVQYNLQGTSLWKDANATVTLFTDGGTEKRQLFIHRATMTNLKPAKFYNYRVGNEDAGWSAIFSYRAPITGPDWSPVVAIYGDLGNVNGRSIGRLQTEAEMRSIDAVFHVGDFAYNMEDVSIPNTVSSI